MLCTPTYCLADGSTVYYSSVIDVPIHLFGQSTSLDISVQCCMLDHLSSDLVFGMDWLQPYNPVIDWIGSMLDLCIDSVSLTIIGTSAG